MSIARNRVREIPEVRLRSRVRQQAFSVALPMAFTSKLVTFFSRSARIRFGHGERQ
jgi:hypothetical protein